MALFPHFLTLPLSLIWTHTICTFFGPISFKPSGPAGRSAYKLGWRKWSKEMFQFPISYQHGPRMQLKLGIVRGILGFPTHQVLRNGLWWSHITRFPFINSNILASFLLFSIFNLPSKVSPMSVSTFPVITSGSNNSIWAGLGQNIFWLFDTKYFLQICASHQVTSHINRWWQLQISFIAKHKLVEMLIKTNFMWSLTSMHINYILCVGCCYLIYLITTTMEQL